MPDMHRQADRKIRDIETTWSTKYENRWPSIREEIENKVLFVKNGEVPEFHKDFLMRFYTSMDWRGFATNLLFTQAFDALCKDAVAFDEIEIPVDERELPFFETAYDYFKHCFVSSQIGAQKPSRKFFDHCFSVLRENDLPGLLPEEVIIIGDSISSDISGGLDYGMRTCLYQKGDRGPFLCLLLFS